MAALRRLVGPNRSLSHASLLPSTFLICCRGVAFRLLVEGLSSYTTEQRLAEAFSPYGQVFEAKIAMDSVSGRSKGFGFVTLSKDDAEKAVTEMDGMELNGQVIFVRYSKLITSFGGGMPIARGPPEPTADKKFVELKGRWWRQKLMWHRWYCTSHLPSQLKEKYGPNTRIPFFSRPISSKASEQPGQTGSKNQPGQSGSETRKDISTVEDPIDASARPYAPQLKEYKVFNKALKRIQDDGQVRVRIGSPITGYGQESEDYDVHHYIPNKIWTDDDGVEHVEINFYIRGPHGAGKVYTEMFKDQVDKQWKYTQLIVVIISPTLSQLILESYMSAYNVDTN
ncbi:uncharacterized protein LOC132191904 [Corylus avellana]|uniref:uncharacterized protein LOC132191904 n=1 Tax=Corylus avellana TaxID=13451 RepID=UPI00286A4B89|nr:uncharacterized protein LOC132191904 [Corylus avellana]